MTLLKRNGDEGKKGRPGEWCPTIFTDLLTTVNASCTAGHSGQPLPKGVMRDTISSKRRAVRNHKDRMRSANLGEPVPFLPTPRNNSFNIMAAVSEALKKASGPDVEVLGAQDSPPSEALGVE